MTIFDWAARLRATPGFGWGLAAFSFLCAVALRFAISDYLPGGFPFLTFFPAVLMTAFLGGTRPGIFCAVASSIAAWYLFIDPVYSFALDYQGAVALGFFVVIIAIDIAIIHTMNEALEATRRDRAAAEHLADQRSTLFQELQHRVANNLAFVSSLLSIHRRRHAAEPEVSAAFDDVRLRLDTMSRVHRRLYDPASADTPVGDILEGLCADMIASSGRDDIQCRVDADLARLPLDRLMPLSLVLIEAASNSLKHGFAKGGTLHVSLRESDKGMLELRIADDGPGLPEGFDPDKSDRLGFRIMAGFARNLRGELSFGNENGAVTRLTFPAQ